MLLYVILLIATTSPKYLVAFYDTIFGTVFL